MSSHARLLVVDGHAYAYRAFHAIRHLHSPNGRPTNAIFGFTKALAKLRDSLQPSHVAVVWDGGLSAERVAALPGYKAQRPEMPAALAEQLDEIVSYLQAAGVVSLCAPGVEADDWIAGLARAAVAHGLRVVIASPDKDFLQLVTPEVGLVNPSDKTGRIWTEADVCARAGVSPAQIVGWLSLVGDSVDNIPGVAGVGPKTAADLLNEFGSVEALYQRLDRLKSDRLRASLQAAAADVRRNLELIRLRDELPRAFAPAEFEPRPADRERLRELGRRWGFKTLAAEAGGGETPQGDLFASPG